MKKLFTLLLALLLLVGCGGGQEGDTGDTDTDNKTVTVVSSMDVISMDTAVATDGTSFIAQTMCLAGLMELDANQNPIPDLAESYTVSDDGLVYTFKIRDDANWSNGDPVTAQDFVYGWQRVVVVDISRIILFPFCKDGAYISIVNGLSQIAFQLLLSYKRLAEHFLRLIEILKCKIDIAYPVQGDKPAFFNILPRRLALIHQSQCLEMVLRRIRHNTQASIIGSYII